MYNQIESSVPNLKSLYIDITTYGLILVPLLNNKLPSELRVIFWRKCENDIWSLYDMLKCLKTEVETKEWSIFIGTSSELEKEDKDRKYTTSSFLNNAQGKRCHFCALSNHVTSNCLKVTNAASRKQSLHRKGMCCMFSDNLASFCYSKYKYHRYLYLWEKGRFMTRLPQTFLITGTTFFYKLLQLLCRIYTTQKN